MSNRREKVTVADLRIREQPDAPATVEAFREGRQGQGIRALPGEGVRDDHVRGPQVGVP
jgi:hypothetical protein